MELEVLSSQQLYDFLHRVLRLYSFKLYMHVITEPYITLLAKLPAEVRRTSTVYLDGEKSVVNDYAARRLLAAGYRVYYVNKLHGKVIVIGSRPDYIVIGTSNLTSRSLKNFEVVLVIKKPSREVYEKILEVFIRPVEEQRYVPKL